MSSKNQIESDFICQPKYSNNLPEVPTGPYFKDTKEFRKFEDFAPYHFSSLERSYVWHPHFGPEVGIKLELVDQDAICYYEKPGSALDQADLRYLTTSAAGKGLKSEDKPFWLRNTTYQEINMSRAEAKQSDGDSQVKKTLRTKDVLHLIEQSFVDVDLERQKLLASKSKKVMSIFPVNTYVCFISPCICYPGGIYTANFP